MTLSEFHLFELSSLLVLGETFLKHQNFRWTNIFIIEILICANFVQTINFERSQFELPSLQVLGENCFEA